MSPTLDKMASSALFDRMIKSGPAHMRPIFEVARSNGIGLLLLQQNVGAFDVPTDRTVIAIVGDDAAVSCGPDAFHLPSLRKILGRCQMVAVVACEPVSAAYTGAACAATIGMNACIIETRTEHEISWCNFALEAAPAARILVCAVAGHGGHA